MANSRKKHQANNNANQVSHVLPSCTVEVVDDSNCTSDVTTSQEETKPSKQDLLVRNLFLYNNVQQAAIEAGYSPSTARATIYTLMKKPKFQERLRQYAIANDVMNLPRIYKIENQVMEHLEANPLDLPKFKDTIKQKKMIAGVLKPEVTVQQQPTLSIGEVKNLLLNVHNVVSD